MKYNFTHFKNDDEEKKEGKALESNWKSCRMGGQAKRVAALSGLNST